MGNGNNGNSADMGNGNNGNGGNSGSMCLLLDARLDVQLSKVGTSSGDDYRQYVKYHIHQRNMRTQVQSG